MYTKFSPGLFLEQIELERFQKAIDEEGFRKFLLENTLKFGLVDRQYFNDSNVVQNQFENALVYESAGLTISHKEIKAIDSNGLLIYRPETTNISVPTDSVWYWIKIKHIYSSKESGLFSIDTNGNLIGDSDAELLSVLRGQPHFPSRVRFLNSAQNILEYDVLEVIDDQNAVLQGYFTAETDLQLSVVGTFAPDVTPTTAQKDIFQYDSCTLSFVAESSTNVAPSKTEGEEFYIARVKSDGVTLTIQDKRTEKWETGANTYLRDVDKNINNLLGVERIKYDHSNSTRDRNIVELSWGMVSSNWSVNSKLNLATFSSGSGGRYKDVSYFNDGDFDGWRLYWPDGSYSNIVSSVKNGGQINMTLDRLDIDKVSNDGGTTFESVDLIAAPNAEEIEIQFIPWSRDTVDVATPDADQPTQAAEVVTFPILQRTASVKLLVYDENVQYGIRYRYRKNSEYSAVMNMLADTNFGYYAEQAFDDNGVLLPAVAAASYSANVGNGDIRLYNSYQIILILKDDAYINQINSIDLGDLLGVETIALSAAINDITLTVGEDRQYQYISGADISLTNNKRVVLADGLRNGNFFILHFKQKVTLNDKTLTITDSAFNTLKEFNYSEIEFLNNSPEGIYIRCTWDGTQWILNSLNDVVRWNPSVDTAWSVSMGSSGSTTFYFSDESGGHISSQAWLPPRPYDRALNIIVSQVFNGPGAGDPDVLVDIENGVGSGIIRTVGRVVTTGSIFAIIPANCRYQIRATTYTDYMNANVTLQKKGIY